MRYKITIEYDGTNYNGWQKQEGEFSIQESLEKAIELFSNEKVEVFGAGRTDAGVHALGQVAHFDLSKEFQPFKVISAINFYLKYKTSANAILSNFDKKWSLYIKIEFKINFCLIYISMKLYKDVFYYFGNNIFIIVRNTYDN